MLPTARTITFALLTWLCLAPLVAGQDGPASVTPVGPPPPPDDANGPHGRLMIMATQGTRDGPSAAGDAVEVHLFRGDKPVRKLDATLDEHATVVIDPIPLSPPLRPVVRIMHAGVTYQEIGPLLDPANPDAVIDVVVYATTLEPPDWEIVARDVVTAPSPQGVLVSESLVVENPSDRTWLGGDLDEREQRTSITAILPPGAYDVTLEEGFHGWCCTKFADRLLEVQMPLMPGRAGFRYSYRVPVADDGSARLLLGAPVGSRSVALFVPDRGIDADPHAMTPAGIRNGERGPMRVFEGHAVPASTSYGVVLANLASSPPPIAPATGPNTIGRLLAGVAAAIGLAALLYVVAARKPKPRRIRTSTWTRPVRLVIRIAAARPYWITLTILLLASLAMLLLYAPPDAPTGPMHRILYIHITAAINTFVAAGLVALAGAAYLWYRDTWWDDLADAAARVAVLLCSVVLITGIIWAKRAWGYWWTWSPALTFSLILWLLYLGYIALRRALRRHEMRAAISAVYGIVAALDVPLLLLSVRLMRDVHPSTMRLEHAVLYTLLLWIITSLMLTVGIIAIRFRLARLEQLIDHAERRVAPPSARTLIRREIGA